MALLEADETTAKEALPILLIPLGVRNDSVLEHLHHNLKRNLPSVCLSDISMSLAAENEGTRDRVPVGPLGDDLGASREEHGGTAINLVTGVTQDVPGHFKAVVGEIAEKICSGNNPQTLTESSMEHLVPGKSCLKRLTADGHGLQAGCVDHEVHFPSESQLEECHTYSCADSETSQDTIDIDDIMNLESEDNYLSKTAPPSLRSLVFKCFVDRADDVSCHLQNSNTFGICDKLGKNPDIGDRSPPEINREDVLTMLTEGVKKAEQRGLTECSGMLEIIGVKGMIEGMKGKLEKDSILDGQRFNEDSVRCDDILGEVAILLQELVGTVTMGENVDSNGHTHSDKDGDSVEGKKASVESQDNGIEGKAICGESKNILDVEIKEICVESKDICVEIKDNGVENNNLLQRMDKSIEQKGTDIDSNDGNVMDETIGGPVSRTLTVSTGDEEINVSSLGSDKVISNPSQSVYRAETTPEVVQSTSQRLLQGQYDSNEISYSPLSQGSDDVSLFDSASEDSQVEAELKGQAWTEPNGGDIDDLASEDRSGHVIQTSSRTEKEHKNNDFDVTSPVDSPEKDNQYDQGRNVVNCPLADCIPGSQTSLALGDLACSHEAVVIQQASTCTSDTECHVVNSGICDKVVCYPGFMPASQASSVLGDLILSQEVDTDQVPDLPEICWEENKAEDVNLVVKEAERVRISRDDPCDGCDGPIKRLHDLNDEPGDDDLRPEKCFKDNPQTEMKSSSSQKRQGDPVVTCLPQKVPKVEAHTVVPDQEVPGDVLDAMVEKTLFEDQDKKFYSCDMDILDEKDTPLCQTVDDFVQKPDLHQLKLTNSMKADIMRDVPPAKSVFTWKQSPVHYPTYSESNSCNANTGDCETALAVVPLRTVRGPLRLGLSKRQTVRPLHSNVKR